MEHLSKTLELDETIPPLIVQSENKQSGSNLAPQNLPSVEDRNTSPEAADGKAVNGETDDRKISPKTDVKFYVETGSDVSTSSAKSNQENRKKKVGKSESPPDTSRTAEYAASGVKDAGAGKSSGSSFRLHMSDTSEDENGNNMVTHTSLSTSAPESSRSDMFRDEWMDVKRIESEGSLQSSLPEAEDEMAEEEEKGLVHISVGRLRIKGLLKHQNSVANISQIYTPIL